MLQLLDESLKSFLISTVPLAPSEVDIAFEAPDGDWAVGVSRPTVDLYLWEVRPNLDQAELGFVDTPLPSGAIRRQSPRPRLDCRYLVTAWTSEVADEHALLGQVLLALLTNPIVPAEHLAGALAAVSPLPSLTLSPNGSTSGSDFWSALGGQLKPALDLVVTLTVDAASIRAAGPPVESVFLRHVDTATPVAGQFDGRLEGQAEGRTQPRREVRLHPADHPAPVPDQP